MFDSKYKHGEYLIRNKYTTYIKILFITILLIGSFVWYNIFQNTIKGIYNPNVYSKYLFLGNDLESILKTKWEINNLPSFFTAKSPEFNSFIDKANNSNSPYSIYDEASVSFNNYYKERISNLNQDYFDTFKEKEEKMLRESYKDTPSLGLGLFLINNIFNQNGGFKTSKGIVSEEEQSGKYHFLPYSNAKFSSNLLFQDVFLNKKSSEEEISRFLEDTNKNIVTFKSFTDSVGLSCNYNSIKLHLYNDDSSNGGMIGGYYIPGTSNIYINLYNPNLDALDNISKELRTKTFFHELLHYCFGNNFTNSKFNDEITSYSITYGNYIRGRDDSFNIFMNTVGKRIEGVRDTNQYDYQNLGGEEFLVFSVLINKKGNVIYTKLYSILNKTEGLKDYFSSNEEYTQFVIGNLINSLVTGANTISSKEEGIASYKDSLSKIKSLYPIMK